MKNFLSQQERESLKSQHKSERDRRVCDRIKAVLLADDGWSYDQIAHALLLSDQAIRGHIQDHQRAQKLKPENHGYAGKLTALQTDELVIHLREHTYLYAKEIVAYVRERFHIDYTVEGMTCWLKMHGFSYKKPAIVPGKADREVQKKWMEEYETLKNNLSNDETICFIDGVHPTHNTKLSYGWIPTGKRKELPTNTGRCRLNLSGSIDIISKRVICQEDLVLNAASTITFLTRVEQDYPEKKRIHIFCDNARYYKNRAVTDYLKRSKITLHFLPPYSPNLNPIERLWKWMNECVLYNRYFEKFSSFKEAVLGFLRKLAEPSEALQEIVGKRIRDRFHPVG